MASFFGYIAAYSFIFEGIYHLSAKEYGLVFGGNGIGLMVFSQLTGWLSMRFGERQLLGWGLRLMGGRCFEVLSSCRKIKRSVPRERYAFCLGRILVE